MARSIDDIVRDALGEGEQKVEVSTASAESLKSKTGSGK